MNFKSLLEQEHSKTITTNIVDEICRSPIKMKELMHCFVEGPITITQRAAWPLSFIAQKHPHLLLDYYTFLIEHLQQPNQPDSINRNILRAFQFAEIPEQHQGIILTECFKFLNSSSEPIAIKVFSMTVIYNLTKTYPDIIPELRSSIENLLPDGSAGLKSRGLKILKATRKYA